MFTFWGGAGSPGRTTLAINWGTLLGSAARTIVVDLDLTGAAVAAQLDDTAGETGRRRRVSPNLVELASTNPQTFDHQGRESGLRTGAVGVDSLDNVDVRRLALATRMIFPEVQIAEPQSAELTDPHSRVAQPRHDHPVARCADRIEHRLTCPIRKCAGKLPRRGSVG